MEIVLNVLQVAMGKVDGHWHPDDEDDVGVVEDVASKEVQDDDETGQRLRLLLEQS